MGPAGGIARLAHTNTLFVPAGLRLARTSCPLTSVKLAQGVITGLCASHVQPLVARIAGGGLADLTSVVLDRKVVDGDAAMSAILQGVQLIRKDLKVTLV